ncbi:MAG: hypothetical protein WC980_09085 [Candidatus Brocadiia bacterium]
MKNRTKIIVVLGACLIGGALYGFYSQMNNKPVAYCRQDMSAPLYTKEEGVVNQMWESAKTPQEKELAISKLIQMVKDNKEDILLRAHAIRKLGKIGVLEVQDIAKDISDTGVWRNKVSDMEHDIIGEIIQEKMKVQGIVGDERNEKYHEVHRDLYVNGEIYKLGISTEKLIQLVLEKETDIDKRNDAKRKLENIGLKHLDIRGWYDKVASFIDAANETYHRLRYLRETDPEKKYQLLLDVVKNSGGEAQGWAEEQLILSGEERALPDIIEVLKRAYGDTEEEYIKREIKTYRAKFAVVKAAKNDPTVYEKIVNGKYSFLYSDDEEIRDSVTWWVAKIGGFKTDEIILGTENEDKDKDKDKEQKDKEHGDDKDGGKDDKSGQPDKK